MRRTSSLRPQVHRYHARRIAGMGRMTGGWYLDTREKIASDQDASPDALQSLVRLTREGTFS